MDPKARLISGAAMAVTAFAVSKGIEFAWRLATGNKPPSQEEGDSLTRLMVFAAVSAVAVTAAQHLASKRTNQFIESHGY